MRPQQPTTTTTVTEKTSTLDATVSTANAPEVNEAPATPQTTAPSKTGRQQGSANECTSLSSSSENGDDADGELNQPNKPNYVDEVIDVLEDEDDILANIRKSNEKLRKELAKMPPLPKWPPTTTHSNNKNNNSNYTHGHIKRTHTYLTPRESARSNNSAGNSSGKNKCHCHNHKSSPSSKYAFMKNTSHCDLRAQFSHKLRAPPMYRNSRYFISNYNRVPQKSNSALDLHQAIQSSDCHQCGSCGCLATTKFESTTEFCKNTEHSVNCRKNAKGDVSNADRLPFYCHHTTCRTNPLPWLQQHLVLNQTFGNFPQTAQSVAANDGDAECSQCVGQTDLTASTDDKLKGKLDDKSVKDTIKPSMYFEELLKRDGACYTRRVTHAESCAEIVETTKVMKAKKKERPPVKVDVNVRLVPKKGDSKNLHKNSQEPSVGNTEANVQIEDLDDDLDALDEH